MREKTAASLWRTIQADVVRLRDEDGSLRTLVRGLSPRAQALLVYRLFRWCYERSVPTQPLRLHRTLHRDHHWYSIPVQVQIGKGLRIHHFGGIIMRSETVVGEGCTIYHGVTLRS
jgi:serine O-acetyltransferase